MEIEVGKIYRVKRDICVEGQTLKKGTKVKTKRIDNLPDGQKILVVDVEEEYKNEINWYLKPEFLEELEPTEPKNMEEFWKMVREDINTVSKEPLENIEIGKVYRIKNNPFQNYPDLRGNNVKIITSATEKGWYVIQPINNSFYNMGHFVFPKEDLEEIKSNNEMDIKEKIRQIANHYGLRHQQQKLLEELGELITAGAKEDKDENFVEEMADVSIMIEQAIYLLKKESQFAEVREKKIARQIKRIEEERLINNGEKWCKDCKYFSYNADNEPCKNCLDKEEHPNWERK